MTQSAAVLIHWLQNSSGDLPLGRQFCRPARFDHQGEDWTQHAWSVVVDIDGRPDARGYQDGTVRFLMPGAPQSWLAQGRRFTIFDGPIPVAEAEVRHGPGDATAGQRKRIEA